MEISVDVPALKAREPLRVPEASLALDKVVPHIVRAHAVRLLHVVDHQQRSHVLRENTKTASSAGGQGENSVQ